MRGDALCPEGWQCRPGRRRETLPMWLDCARAVMRGEVNHSAKRKSSPIPVQAALPAPAATERWPQ